ncbi:bifunctional DNA-formamidopyrimidine glycosylase/DNA-(apurinic or apyrimidinic site) lyase [Corynebacterium ulceribovis]|uniref:bifunctional DNA-formamidopyrimidine glycosylase/DNA-(apurinic or apyrimidinic site) lyase n=1 Tax=Corynebacterium ulceribovis TaxID=487732 RepID=UPI000375A9FB|nr:bifunctional DNA-formamidopyrimidine glycosylase/DNA-(apurinic or apyrimidinic site) lyase [Corynebacterium ulceribovis]
MPELPEVETVRAGLRPHVVGRRVTAAEVFHPRTSRNQLGGAAELVGRLVGRTIVEVQRRGKFLWLELDDDQSTVVHLGMSGQLRIGESPTVHRRATITLDDGTDIHFLDQRTFGYIRVCDSEPDPFSSIVNAGRPLPSVIKHIAPDLLEVMAADALPQLAGTLRTKKSEIKRVLLNQNVVSGIGNIYADEMLWRAQLHPRRAADGLSQAEAEQLLAAGADVLKESLAAGGTSFDALYVNVNGESGYFGRALHAYGQKFCSRCGGEITAEKFMNRRSFYCAACQPL